MHSNVVVFKNKGSLIPNGYLKQVEATYDKAFGLAMLWDKEIVSITTDDNLKASVFDVFDSQIQAEDEYKDIPQLFYFAANDTAKFQPEDLQPFTLLTDGDKKLLVAFLEGDFPDYDHASAHIKEFYAVNEYLKPKIESLYELVGRDISKLLGQLKSGPNNHDILKASCNLGGRASVILFASNGEIVRIDSNKDFGSYPWGWTTNTLGFKDGLQSKEMLQQKIATLIMPTREVAKTDTTLPASVLLPKVRPPQGLSNKSTKEWYRANNAEEDASLRAPANGILPMGWERRVPITIRKDRISKHPELVVLLNAANTSAAPDGPKEGGKDTAPHNLPIVEPWKETPYVIDPKELPKVVDYLEKLDLNNTPISTEEMDNTEKKNKTLAELAGISSDDYLRWKPAVIPDLVTKYPQATQLLLRDLIHKIGRLNHQLYVKGERIIELELEVDDIATKYKNLLTGAAATKPGLTMPSKKTA